MELFFKISMTLLVIAMVWFVFAAYKAIKKIIKERVEEEAKTQTYEKTKMICDFMGWEIWKPWIAKIKWFDHDMVTTPFGSYEIKKLDWEIKRNWDFLNEISEKIHETPTSKKDGMFEWLSIEWNTDKINPYDKEDVFNIIVRFIDWYNDSE